MLALTARNHSIQGKIALPSSKSESNRSLIIQALNPEIHLSNLSSARDTQTMIRLLQSNEHVLDVIDAGTTMRFLTAYCAATGKGHLITGTPRMCNRPIGGLVNALRELGADINHWKQEGYPPLQTQSRKGPLHGGAIKMPGNISSQFISAILLVSPYLSDGLELTLTDGITSRPYLEMTMSLMQHFGSEVSWRDEHTIVTSPGAYQTQSYSIESDWSGASYWYAIAALSKDVDLTLLGLRESSLQGDRAIVELMENFGISTTFIDGGAVLSKNHKPLPASLTIDCLETPDLAQTLAVIAGALGVNLTLTSLHTLKVKETDRIEALVSELSKFGLDVVGTDNSLTISGTFKSTREVIQTYDDHRMAMAFAPLALKTPFIQLDDPEVVVKSYPEYWDHLREIGIN